MSNIKTKMSYLFNDYTWICAWRKSNSTFEKQCINHDWNGFIPIQNEPGTWIADPFLYKDEHNDIYLFVEYTNIKKKKSALAAKKLYPSEDSEFTVIYELPYHTSYPCIFEWNGSKYIVPETEANREVILLKCEDWPYKWYKKAVLLKNTNAVDSTVFENDGELKILLYEYNSEYTVSIGDLNPVDGIIENKKIIRRYDQRISRPGGNIIHGTDGLIMVRQPGIHFYGEKIEFVKMGLRENQKDVITGEILPSNIELKLDGKIIGVHTYNRIDDFGIEIIDLFIKRLNLLKPFIICLHKARIFGYGEYERDRKMLWKKAR